MFGSGFRTHAVILVVIGCGRTAPPPPPAATGSASTLVSPAAVTAISASNVVLYDPHITDAPHVKMLVGSDRLTLEEQTRVLDRVFSGGYLKDPRQCRGAAQDLAGSRRAGDFSPSLIEAATGSFTVPKSSQMLYLITTGECGASHADNSGSTTLAVLDGDALV